MTPDTDIEQAVTEDKAAEDELFKFVPYEYMLGLSCEEEHRQTSQAIFDAWTAAGIIFQLCSGTRYTVTFDIVPAHYDERLEIMRRTGSLSGEATGD